MTFIASQFLEAIPPEPEPSVVEWARRHVRLIGSARSETYDPDVTPWTKAVIEASDDGQSRVVTFVKPVQSGGSAAGEIALCRWLAVANGGDIQYNWEDDVKAPARWKKRIKKILQATPAVLRRWPMERSNDAIGLVIFPHCNLTVQGVFTESNVASDSIRYQINEEIHNWEPGRLKQAYNRTTAFWNSVILNISNASDQGDQLHEAFLAGTQQHWQVQCPGCGECHAMRTRWEDKHPELGGLRYDSDGCKDGDGGYDYQKLAPTIRYQFPCGHTITDTIEGRRKLSLGGRYSEPQNPGAPLTHKSFTLEAVSVDYIPWLSLIQEKHDALRAMRRGDPSLWRTYLKERECRFQSPDDRPNVRPLILNTGMKKNRIGMAGRHARFAALDRQQGEISKGELPHWWLMIVDAMPNGDAALIWEGKCVNDEDVIGTLREHEVKMHCVVADSGDDTTHVYNFCLNYGINAIKGTGEALHHPDKSRRIYGVEKPLHSMVTAPPKYSYVNGMPDPREPLFWFYHKSGILDRLAWIESSKEIKFEIPGDVSEEYKAHMESWELQQRKVGASKQVENVWVQVRKRDDLKFCKAYCVMLMEMAGLIGARIETK